MSLSMRTCAPYALHGTLPLSRSLPRSLPLSRSLPRSLLLLILAVGLRRTLSVDIALPLNSSCGIDYKPLSDGTCALLENSDVSRAMHFLAHPPDVASCSKTTYVQNIAICEDNMKFSGPEQCLIWSLISSNQCDHYGSIEFEIYWAQRGCHVVLYHTHIYAKSKCNTPAGKIADHPNIHIIRDNMWGGGCFNCIYKTLQGDLLKTAKIDILKIQNRAGVQEDFDGVQFTVLADMFLHTPHIIDKVQQLTFTTSITADTLVDLVGREAEHAWNMWAAQQLISRFGSFHSASEMGPQRLQPTQFSHLLQQAKLDPGLCFYHNSLMKVPDAMVIENKAAFEAWQPYPAPSKLWGKPPPYCPVPSPEKDEEMQAWIDKEMKARCHATRLAVPCIRHRLIDAFIPCPGELMDNLAEDYAAMKGWCNFEDAYASVPVLQSVDKGAGPAFRQPSVRGAGAGGAGVRLAFFFTVYHDSSFVIRLFKHLYSPHHYYLFHIDAAGASARFEREMRLFAANYSNVFCAKDVKIVYGASTATILLTKAMAWFDKYAIGWDYFVPVTGSDYPLVPLRHIEKIFAFQSPPMPFVMAWTPGTSTHIFRLQTTHPIFESDPLLARSITAVTDERGRVLGAVPMEFRSNNFGPPLFCNGKSSFYHLDNRQNKSARIFDTQWLFPRDIQSKRGRAYAEYDPRLASPSFDKGWRIWKKSDPGTTGAYDRESVSYIVNSLEGRKYWHYFKHMLLGSEEHYYVSLLYNWNRTQSFVQTLSAQMVWNTWKIGLWESNAGFQTHTHFLTLNEWDILHGFAKRGMIFARKFSTKKTAALLDKIDAAFLHNESTDAGLYWPGFFEVDTTTPGREWKQLYKKKRRIKKSQEVLRMHVKGEQILSEVSSPPRGSRKRTFLSNLIS